MVYVDTQKSLLTYIYDLLTKDDDLKIIMGNEVRLFLTWATPDATFPYLVHRIDIRAANDFFPMRQGTYLLDIWSNSPNADEILAIRQRIIALLDELNFDTSEAVGGRLWLQTDGFIAESEQDIWHYAFQFSLRYYRQSETVDILSR